MKKIKEYLSDVEMELRYNEPGYKPDNTQMIENLLNAMLELVKYIEENE